MSTTQEYVAPEEENLDGGEGNKTPIAGGKKNEVVAKSTTVSSPKQPSLEETPNVIGVGRMTNAKGDTTTDVIKDRITRHFEYLRGKLSFKDDATRIEEQITFIETIGNVFKLDYEQYVVVTDYLLNAVREAKEVFTDGTAFRFTKDLDKQYPIENIRQYRDYMALLTMISNNWPRRHELHKFVDPTYAIKDLNRLGKVNVTQYINQLTQRV